MGAAADGTASPRAAPPAPPRRYRRFSREVARANGCGELRVRDGVHDVPFSSFARPLCFRRGRCPHRPAVDNVFCGGTHGSRPTGCGGRTGRTESSALLSLRGAKRRGNPFPARRCRAARPPLGGGCRRSRLGERTYRITSLPPSALRAATSLAEGGKGRGLPRQCVPQGHLLRGAHWLAMTGERDVEDAVPYRRYAASPPVLS